MTAVVSLLGLLAGTFVVAAIAIATGTGGPSAVGGTGRAGIAERLAGLNVTAGRAAAAIGAAAVVVAISGWPVAGVLTVAAWFGLPSMAAGGARVADLSRVEAVATWTEMLRDTLAAAGGLQQSIVATASIAPPAIRTELLALADRVHREPLTSSLRRFADDLDDATGDLVVSALLLAADRSPRQLAPLLTTLAAQARASVAARLRVEAGRARTRSSVRIITLITIGFAVGLVLLNPAYVEAYSDLAGQLVLLLIGGLFAAGLAWIGRASHGERAPRLFDAVGAQR